MSTERPRYTVSVDQELFNKIEDYKFKMRYGTRSDATVDLIEKGLSALNSGTPSPIKISPAPAKPETGERDTESQKLLESLVHSFDSLNMAGKQRLEEYAGMLLKEEKYAAEYPEAGKKFA